VRALITGGVWVIGSHLAEALLEQGDAVTVVDDLSTGRFANIEHLVGRPGFQFAIETITNEAVMDRLISECEIIYHLAAAVGWELIVPGPSARHRDQHQGVRGGAAHRGAATQEDYAGLHLGGIWQERGAAVSRGCGLRDRGTSRARWSYACSKAMDEFLPWPMRDNRPCPW